jgi:hypothetical protein
LGFFPVSSNNLLHLGGNHVTALDDKPSFFFISSRRRYPKAEPSDARSGLLHGANMTCKTGWVVMTFCVLTAFISWTDPHSASSPWPEIHSAKTSRLPQQSNGQPGIYPRRSVK